MDFLDEIFRLFSDRTSDNTEVQKDEDLQDKCKAYRHTLKNLFIAQRDLELQQCSHTRPLRPVQIHANYRELDACAQKCVACRIFRKALILRQSSSKDAANLEKRTDPVFITLLKDPSSDDTTLRVSIGRRSDDARTSALVSCTASNAITSPSLHPNPRHPSIAREAKTWLDTCTATHPECGNLRTSSTNPTRLLEIQPAGGGSHSVQLIHPHNGRTYSYAALSYCWGPPAPTNDKPPSTTTHLTTPANLPARTASPFPTAPLPPTLRDAIALVAALGTRYIWIDALCIVQGRGGDWASEAARMHEVYGNAAFTLCVASNDAATQPLFAPRTAWEYPAVPCRVGGRWWIAAFEVGMAEVRREVPLARRAWTLQEERLSPRVVYWAGQRMYWSCVRARRAEVGGVGVGEGEGRRRPMVYGGGEGGGAEDEAAQGFLETRRKDTGEGLHRSWLGIVESYTRRRCTNAGDRFPALSGLAAKYLEVRKDDEYLAGLWKQSLAEDLSWSPSIVVRDGGVKPEAPSWSWASLLFGVGADWKLFSATEEFEVVSGRSKREEQHSIVDAINDGARVTYLHVRGRMRPFQDSQSTLIPWSNISRSVHGQERFSFGMSPESSIHSVDLSSGRVLAYHALREEVIGQLDYFEDVCRSQDGNLYIFCLEIGNSVMLLLEQCELGCGYRRVGLSRGYRKDFFVGADTAELQLC